MIPPVRVRELIHLRPEDYEGGTTGLTLRVTAVPAELVDPDWVEIKGIEIRWNGDRGDERQVRVRVSALCKQHGRGDQ